MKYLVTGGYGLIGSEVVNSLVDEDVRVVSRTNVHKWRVTRPVKELVKDINELTLEDVDVDVIYHLASTVDNYHVLSDPYVDINTNLKGMIHLLELVKKLTKKPKIIFTSSFFVYGNVFEEDQKPINENSRTDPLALYGATKLCAESILKLYSKMYDIPYVIVRFSNVYGEKDDVENNKKGAISKLIWKAVNKEVLPIYNNGEFYRDYIYVSDVVTALRLLEEKATNDTFLIAYGKKVKFSDMIDFIVKKTGATTQAIEPPPFHKIVGIGSFVTDTKKMTSLGWKPQVDYKEGLGKIIKHALSTYNLII